MKAVLYKHYGLPDVLEIGEVQQPTPKDNELLIKVYASTVNRTDNAKLRAKPFIMRCMTGLIRPKNQILGTDFAGEIVGIGNGVSEFNVGDRVFGFDDDGLSSHAEYLTIAADDALATIPNNITFEEAAASIEGAHYAFNFIDKAKINPGDKVLVYGATGAIGTAAVQLLKHHGAVVTAVCTQRNFELVRSLGAEELIDYTKQDFTRIGGIFQCVFDTVGKSTFKKCKPLLLPRGVYISSELGPMAQNVYLPLITRFLGGKNVRFPIPRDRLRSVLLIKKLMEQEEFRPVIDRKYKFEDIADAFRYIETEQKIGNVVITIAGNI